MNTRYILSNNCFDLNVFKDRNSFSSTDTFLLVFNGYIQGSNQSFSNYTFFRGAFKYVLKFMFLQYGDVISSINKRVR